MSSGGTSADPRSKGIKYDGDKIGCGYNRMGEDFSEQIYLCDTFSQIISRH
jgi:hypothetical protein